MQNKKNLYYFGWFLKLWKEYAWQMTGVILFTVITITIKTAFPVLLKNIIDQLTGDYQPATVYHMLLIYLGFTILHEFVQHALPYTRGLMNHVFARNLRNKYFHIYTNKKSSFFKHFRTGDLLTRLTADIDGDWDRISWYSCSGLMRPLEAILILSMTLGVMFHYSVSLTLFSFIPLPFLVLILAKAEEKMTRYTLERQESISRCNNVLEACFSGIRVIKTTLSEEDQQRKYDEALQDRVVREKRFLKMNQVIHFYSMLVNHAGSIIVIFIGSILVIKNGITLGTFLLFITYMRRLIEPIWTLSWFYASSKQVFKYVDRLDETEESYNILSEHAGTKETNQVDNIEMKDVCFRFHDAEENLLNNINISVKRGETIAIVGKVGSGKSTLLELLAGNLECTSGEIDLNGFDIHTYNKADVAKLVGYIRQENILFSETIQHNLELGNEFTAEEINNSLDISLMTDEINAFPLQMETKLGQKGISLSGGQKQRLSIARTILRKPQLLLMDDCTAAMDAETEKMFWEKLRNMNRDITSVVVTHRLATAKRADKIFVLDEGSIKAEGSNEELLKTSSLYNQIMLKKQENE
ncbi:MAG: ABC transporter ATP-binding protein [Candidatus Cloacimonetes bacterium]|nr:ABC transporter ATP-binding protein [Candidatus Cloacimonadota bacterium]